MMQPTQKQLFKAFLTINALDERKRTGRMDATAQAALEDAEEQISGASGRAVLAAFRAWRDGSVKSHDPTPGYTKVEMDRSPHNTQIQGRAR
jgi:hypothetical protein